MSFVYGNLDDEEWTRALKCMLANIKWIIAWYCKHQQWWTCGDAATIKMGRCY